MHIRQSVGYLVQLVRPLQHSGVDRHELHRHVLRPALALRRCVRCDHRAQQALAGLDVRNRQAAAYPRLLLTGAYGFNGSSNKFGELFAFRGPDSRSSAGFPDQNWFGFGNIGLSLQVPIFDGFRRKYAVQQGRIAHGAREPGPRRRAAPFARIEVRMVSCLNAALF